MSGDIPLKVSRDDIGGLLTNHLDEDILRFLIHIKTRVFLKGFD